MVLLIDYSHQPFPDISDFCTELIVYLWPYKIQCYTSVNASALVELISLDVMVENLKIMWKLMYNVVWLKL